MCLNVHDNIYDSCSSFNEFVYMSGTALDLRNKDKNPGLVERVKQM